MLAAYHALYGAARALFESERRSKMVAPAQTASAKHTAATSSVDMARTTERGDACLTPAGDERARRLSI